MKKSDKNNKKVRSYAVKKEIISFQYAVFIPVDGYAASNRNSCDRSM